MWQGKRGGRKRKEGKILGIPGKRRGGGEKTGKKGIAVKFPCPSFYHFIKLGKEKEKRGRAFKKKRRKMPMTNTGGEKKGGGRGKGHLRKKRRGERSVLPLTLFLFFLILNDLVCGEWKGGGKFRERRERFDRQLFTNLISSPQ